MRTCSVVISGPDVDSKHHIRDCANCTEVLDSTNTAVEPSCDAQSTTNEHGKWTEYYRKLGGRANPRWTKTELKRAVRELEKQLCENYQTREEDAAIQPQTSRSNQRAEIQAWNKGIQFP